MRGRVDIYEQRSEYQFVVETIEPHGHGALQLAFDQLKQRLLLEGLFEAGRKRALPRFPRRIGIVSSPKGAVIQDFIEILSRRFPGLHVRLFPARVQGPARSKTSAAAWSISARAAGLSWWSWRAAAARSKTCGPSTRKRWRGPSRRARFPVVSAIGHETDITIADFVADLRAPRLRPRRR